MKEIPFANALAFVSGLIYVICALGIALARDSFIAIVNTVVHRIDLAALPVKERTIGETIIGSIVIVISAWILGYIFAYCYNWCSKKFAK